MNSLRRLLSEKIKNISLPVYDVAKFFFLGIRNGSIRQRAGSVAYSLFLSIFPAVIFLFTLIPYIPIDNFQESLLGLIGNFLPANVYTTVETTIVNIVTQQRGSLLSLTFFFTVFSASSGIVALMRAFNTTYHSVENRTWWKRRLVAILMVFIEVVLTTAAVGLIIVNRSVYNRYFTEHPVLLYVFMFVRIITGIGLFFFSISFLFFLAPAKRGRFRFISPGATLATILIIAASYGFRFFVNNFGQFNKLYGSLSSIIVALIYIYIICFALIIGFELNASIMEHRQHDQKQQQYN
jgi:membrane protein